MLALKEQSIASVLGIGKPTSAMGYVAAWFGAHVPGQTLSPMRCWQQQN